MERIKTFKVILRLHGDQVTLERIQAHSVEEATEMFLRHLAVVEVKEND